MGLFSFLQRNDADAAPKKPARSGAKSSAAEDVQVLRIRARRRLIGAAVLVAAGVVGFPLVFETQPRPIPVDLPIEIPRKDVAPPLVVPTRESLTPTAEAAVDDAKAPPGGVPAALTAAATPAAPPAKASAEAVADKAVEKPAEKAAVKPTEKVADKVAEKAASKPAEKPVVKTADKVPEKAPEKTADKAADKAKSSADAARAQALLDGRETAAPRYIVQVGAFGENKAAQEVRGKVEKLGLKTYAQAVDTADGHRVRVRLGPFASRDEAERAAAKLKSAGLPGAILTL